MISQQSEQRQGSLQKSMPKVLQRTIAEELDKNKKTYRDWKDSLSHFVLKIQKYLIGMAAALGGMMRK